MNFTLLRAVDLAKQRDVVILGDYRTCPSIKSEKAMSRMILVKFDGNSRSIKGRRIHSGNNHHEPFENRTLGVLLQ